MIMMMRIATMTTINYVGIDYSLTSPAVCIMTGEKFTYENCKFHFIAQKKSQIMSTTNLVGHDFFLKDWATPQVRYDALSNIVTSNVNSKSVIAIEDYSYASKGSSILQMAENCSVMKYNLYKTRNPFLLVSPKTIKKFATGNGNAGKELMYEYFVKDTGVELHDILETRGIKNTSPTSDVVDSYFICKYLFAQKN